MQIVKPQALMVHTTRTQIGDDARLGMSVGVGFRLDDPRVLVHETAVWESLKAGAPSVPLFEAGLPKQHAEWLAIGHAVARARPGSRAEWSASVALHSVTKAVSCVAQAFDVEGAAMARLAVDARHAWAGTSGENPLGVSGDPGAAPLQQVRSLGVSASPLSAMGALGTDWPERRRWKPRFARSIEAMARDGSHMGWPARLDLRYFQQAAPDQWSTRAEWPVGAPFELRGFGARGDGFAGNLPALAPALLLRRRDGATVPPFVYRQQTVWFLPDQGIGVLWWNCHAPLAYPFDDQPRQLVAALHEQGTAADMQAIADVAGRRTDLNSIDPAANDDAPLMPPIAQGWTWEMILAPEDHPRFAPPRLPYEAVRERVDRHRAELRMAGESRRDPRIPGAADLIRNVAADPEATRRWRKCFEGAPAGVLRDEQLRGADLSGCTFDGWRFVNVSFDGCLLDDSTWQACHLDNVRFAHTSCRAMRWSGVQWKRGGMVACRMDGAMWRDSLLESVDVDGCGLDRFRLDGGRWNKVSVQRSSGRDGRFERTRWEATGWIESALEATAWCAVEADGLTLVDCRMPGLRIADSRLARTSGVGTDLADGVWMNVHAAQLVLAGGSSIARTTFTDCVFVSSTWQNVHAPDMAVEFGSFDRLNVQRMDAQRSRWSMSTMDGMDGMHANFAQASFDRCSLEGARLLGADLRGSRMVDCNLTGLQRSWSFAPDPGAWRGNLTLSEVAVPERRP